MENNSIYDLIIVGSGPAGLTASIYASCFHLKHLIITREVGGQLLLAPDILNYPGFGNISGKELAQRMLEQVKKRGGEVLEGSVVKINKSNNPIIQSSNLPAGRQGNPINKQIQNSSIQQFNKLTMKQWNGEDFFEVEILDGKKYQAKSIILATGTERRKLNLPGEIEYTARGVHYCATCEKFDYEGKVCAVVGGANSAVQAAVELAQAASRVYIIYRGSQLRGDPIWLAQVDKNPNIEPIYNATVTEILGDGQKLTGVRLQSTNNPITSRSSGIHDAVIAHPPAGGSQTASGQSSNLPAGRQGNPINAKMENTGMQELNLDKIFVEIGGVPGTALVIPLGVEMDPGGYIKVNDRLATNVPGVFAAGDLVSYGLSIEQIASSVGLGARAAASAFAYIKQEKAPTLWGGSQIRR